METILTPTEAERIFNKLPDLQKDEIRDDQIRYGEYFIAKDHGDYFRINPINVVWVNGRPKSVVPHQDTII